MTIIYIDAVSEQLPATDTTIYTCPALTKSAHILYANCTNEDATATTVAINIVQSGEAVAVTNLYVAPTTVAAGQSGGVSGLINAVLKPGDFISGIAGDASRLNVKLGIKEIS